MVIPTLTKMWMATKQIMKNSSKELKVHSTVIHDPIIPNFKQLAVLSEHMSSKEQQVDKIKNMLESEHYDYIIATDGSKLGDGRYGRTGAAAVIYKQSINSIPAAELKISLGTESNKQLSG